MNRVLWLFCQKFRHIIWILLKNNGGLRLWEKCHSRTGGCKLKRFFYTKREIKKAIFVILNL